MPNPGGKGKMPGWRSGRGGAIGEAERQRGREFAKQLDAFGANQLNWILGLNPYDSCMLYGVGHNNVDYLVFDSWEFNNAPAGISNGITGGFRDGDDIDFNLTYKQGADNDWRWQEQWLPHDSWYLLAVSAQAGSAK
jgi:hypothetical protein